MLEIGRFRYIYLLDMRGSASLAAAAIEVRNITDRMLDHIQRVSVTAKTAGRAETLLVEVLRMQGRIRSDNNSPFFFAMKLTECGSVSIHDAFNRYGGTLELASKRDAVCVNFLKRGLFSVASRAGEATVLPDNALIYLIREVVGFRAGDSTQHSEIHIQKETFDDVIRMHFGEEVQVSWGQIYSASMTSHFGRISQLLRFLFLENVENGEGCVYSEVSIRLLTEAMIVAIAYLVLRTSRDTPKESIPVTSSELTKRALEIIKAQAVPMTIHEVATQLGIGARTLQASLRKHVGLSPGYLLRLGRLEGAHRDLELGVVHTVQEAARKWGFSNTGRFSGEYKQIIGELPSETIKKNI